MVIAADSGELSGENRRWTRRPPNLDRSAQIINEALFGLSLGQAAYAEASIESINDQSMDVTILTRSQCGKKIAQSAFDRSVANFQGECPGDFRGENIEKGGIWIVDEFLVKFIRRHVSKPGDHDLRRTIFKLLLRRAISPCRPGIGRAGLYSQVGAFKFSGVKTTVK